LKLSNDQMDIFGVIPKKPSQAQPAAVGSSLDRLTWIDFVDMGDSQTPARSLPAWKLKWREGDRVKLRPRFEGAMGIFARVLFTSTFPPDFNLPIMVQVEIRIGSPEAPPVAMTCLPATAIQEHV
jgi:hypothetical protein